jgi:hypothetical protein
MVIHHAQGQFAPAPSANFLGAIKGISNASLFFGGSTGGN